jgi:hypothetical protein
LEGVFPSRAVASAARQEPRGNDKFFGIPGARYARLLVWHPIILAAIMGFADFGEGASFWGLGGQIVHGMLSIGCFTLVSAAFLRFGWKIGLLERLLVFIASHVGLMV